jgi:long-chain acyl-CoA synthetase
VASSNSTLSGSVPELPSEGNSTNQSIHDQFYDSKPWLKFYPQGVAHELQMCTEANISEVIQNSCLKYAKNKSFSIVLPNGMSASLNFAQVFKYSSQFASYLVVECGLKKGDRVAVQMPNCLALPVVTFGVFLAGCVLVNVNPLYTEREMEHQFNDSGAKVLIIIDMFADKLTNVIPKTQIRNVVLTSIADLFSFPLRTVIKFKLQLEKKIPVPKVQTVSFGSALAAGLLQQIEFPGLSLIKSDIAALQYTGGTTGVSKGAVLTHENLLANMVQIQNFGSIKMTFGEEIALTALPLYHIFAFTVNLLSLFGRGNHNILIPSPRPLSNLKKPMEKFKITWMPGVNTLFSGICNEEWFQKSPLKHGKIAVAGGAALQKSTLEKWKKLSPTPLIEGYGLTEASPVVSFSPWDGKAKEGSIGVPLPGTTVRIVNDEGVCVPPGERGELIVKGLQVMLGYWNREDETRKTIKNGWLYTGDVAIMDNDGFLKIVDRKKDMILVSGFNVYPNEVEDVISLHADVLESCVIGVPSQTTGECVRAYVVLKNQGLTENNLKLFCKEKLTSYKVPKEIIFRTELPKTPVGKILRKELRSEALAEMNQK